MNDLKLMSSPRQVDIAITGKCNLNCEYCFYADEMTARTNLPTETWLRFFEELGALGVMTVCLTGGEVFTHPDLFRLMDGVIQNRMRYQLLSNGTLITEKTIEQFAVGKRRQRLDSIQISIDGSRAEIHDQSRPRSFERAVRGLRLLLEAKFPVTVRMTLNRHNVHDLENTARFLLEEVGLPSFSTNEAFPCGATDRTGEIMLTPAQRRVAMDTLTRLSEQYNGRISAQAGPQAYARDWAKMDAALAQGKTTLPGRGRLSSCGGVFNKIAVMHDGVIVPCHNLSTLHLGRVGEVNFGEVWRNHPTMNAVRERYSIPLETLDTCRDCVFCGVCAGGCPGGAVFLTGELNARNPLDCRRVLEGTDPFYRLEDL